MTWGGISGEGKRRRLGGHLGGRLSQKRSGYRKNMGRMRGEGVEIGVKGEIRHLRNGRGGTKALREEEEKQRDGSGCFQGETQVRTPLTKTQNKRQHNVSTVKE